MSGLPKVTWWGRDKGRMGTRVTCGPVQSSLQKQNHSWAESSVPSGLLPTVTFFYFLGWGIEMNSWHFETVGGFFSEVRASFVPRQQQPVVWYNDPPVTFQQESPGVYVPSNAFYLFKREPRSLRGWCWSSSVDVSKEINFKCCDEA